MKSTKKGFSLVELLVVVTIMAILSVTAYLALGGQTAAARNGRRIQDISTIQSALELYYIQHNNAYPATANFATEINKYIQGDMPLDPSSGDSYCYSVNEGLNEYGLGVVRETEIEGETIEPYIVGTLDDFSPATVCP